MTRVRRAILEAEPADLREWQQEDPRLERVRQLATDQFVSCTGRDCFIGCADQKGPARGMSGVVSSWCHLSGVVGFC